MKQHRSSSLLILPMALSLGVVSCHAKAPLYQEVVAQVPAIKGQVMDLLSSRSVQATTADVANGATVSLIDTATGQTVATTVTTATGGFTLSFGSDFKPITGKPYYMEAVKGLPVGGSPNRAGAAIARVRTILFYNWNGWSSLSGGVGFPVSIGKATTTVAAIVNLKGLSAASQSALVGTISGTTFTDPGNTIGSVDYSTVFALVDAAVSADQDPLEALAYDSSGTTPVTQYVLKAGNLLIHDNYSVNGAPSPATASLNAPYNTITFYGQNFPSSASVTIGPIPVATWSVNATRTQLMATLASNGYSGGLQLTQGASTWTGPFVPVSGTVGTLAGGGNAGFADGKGAAALFNNPLDIAMSSEGHLYLSDIFGHKIRKITSFGMVSTLAGSIGGYSEGTGATAQFNTPKGLAVDGNGNVYVADTGNHVIRKVTPAGTVTTFAGSGVAGTTDGTGTSAQFNAPYGITSDGTGNVYVTEFYGHKIRKITSTGVVSTLAGSGVAGATEGATSSAQFNFPTDVVVGGDGSFYILDDGNNRIRKIAAGVVSTLAGSANGYLDGTGTAARFNGPIKMAIDGNDNLYVGDQSNNRIRKVTPAGVVTTIAGTGVAGYVDGAIASAQFFYPNGVVVDGLGNIYVGDGKNNRVRVITP